MTENAFDKSVNYLEEAYSKLNEVEKLKDTMETAKSDYKRISKEIEQEEKNKSDEINNTIKKRKAEINATYDKEIDILNGKLKKLDNKRQSHKSKQQDARFKLETEGLRHEVDDCVSEINNVIKQNSISKICKTDLYYSLFMPKGIKDILILLLWILITVAAVPFSICGIGKYTFLKDVNSKMVYYILIFVTCISMVFIVYLLFVNHTKVRYPGELKYCRNQKDKIRAINRQMRAIRNKIEKDKDESDYNLGDFDAKISALRQELNAVAEKKKKALADFESEKRPVIEKEIAGTYEGRLTELIERQKSAEQLQNNASKEMADIKLDISNQYEAYLGKEYITLDRLQELITIMKEEGASTVGDAVQIYQRKLEG